MTIAELAHQDSLELAVSLLGFDAWLDETAPTAKDWEKILEDMHAEDAARRERKDNTEFSIPTPEQMAHWLSMDMPAH